MKGKLYTGKNYNHISNFSAIQSHQKNRSISITAMMTMTINVFNVMQMFRKCVSVKTPIMGQELTSNY